MLFCMQVLSYIVSKKYVISKKHWSLFHKKIYFLLIYLFICLFIYFFFCTWMMLFFDVIMLLMLFVLLYNDAITWMKVFFSSSRYELFDCYNMIYNYYNIVTILRII